MSGYRLDSGGLVDRSQRVAFRFDGRDYRGFAGDTLASALLADGVRVFGRSFKYHRPRGVLAAGIEEPNALVTIGADGRAEPNTRATDVFISGGMVAVSQNRWPNLGFDIGAVAGLAAPFIPAAFYYKTFFGGEKRWKFYEYFIRRAAGLGAAPQRVDPDHYAHRAAFCDVLVVGAGPAGLAAADAAARAGQRVILADLDARIGGGLLRDAADVEGVPGLAWADAVVARVVAAGGRVLTRTMAMGYFDHDLLSLVQKCVEPGCDPQGEVAQRLWRVRAGRVVLAGGAIERPLAFGGNDLPGVMLAQAVRSYVERFGVAPGRRAVVAGCGDDMLRTAESLGRAGVAVAAVLDSRRGESLVAARGRGGVASVIADIGGRRQAIACDLVAMSGGFTPTVQLHMQAGGTLTWVDAIGAFVPAAARQRQLSAGAAMGVEGLGDVLASGWAAGGGEPAAAPTTGAAAHGWHGTVAAPRPHGKTFVDFQNDVTTADIDLAWREGFRAVEHLKRYTTLGMATDQGKTSNIAGLVRLAGHAGRPPAEVGTTTFRPPYAPVTLGALAGADGGLHMAPRRRLALHDAHVRRDPLWQPLGYWHRPRAYPQPGETLHAAARREARAVRNSVGLTDVSTLAKFDVSGPDAAALLEMVCATNVGKLAVGRGRYTFMLREDGMVMDDGTVWRLGEAHYLLTSSTGGAERMDAHIGYIRHVLAPRLRVAVVPVQEHWAAMAIAGPQARAIIERLAGAAPKHMGCVAATVAGVRGWLLAASYSGERAFELYVPADRALPVWDMLEATVLGAGGALYGLEALELLRIEKGHIVIGAEASGRTTPHDLGLGGMLRGGGYFGHAGLQRPALLAAGRQALVGLASAGAIPEGAMLVARVGDAPAGHVSSAGMRVLGDGGIALGLLAGGMARLGERWIATSPTRGIDVAVAVVAPVFHDPQGLRYRD